MTTKRQREIIKAVWEWIEDTGEVPSQRQLIDHLGGSARDMNEALKAWRAQLVADALADRRRPDLPDEVWSLMKDLWAKAVEEGRRVAASAWDTERSTFQGQLDQLTLQIETARAELTTMAEAQDAITAERDVLKAELEALRTEHQAVTAERDQVAAELTEQTEARDALARAFEELRANYDRHRETTTEEIKQLKHAHDADQARWAQQIDAARESEKTVQAERAKIEATLREVMAEQTGVKTQLASIQQQRDEANALIVDLRGQLDTQQWELLAVTRREAETRTELKHYQQAVADLQQRLNDIDRLRGERNAARAERDSFDRELRQCREELAAARMRIEYLERNNIGDA